MVVATTAAVPLTPSGDAEIEEDAKSDYGVRASLGFEQDGLLRSGNGRFRKWQRSEK